MEDLLKITAEEFEDLKQREVEESGDTTTTVVPPPDIVAFTEQRSCADIFRMYEKKQLDINPSFQRGEVWSKRAQTLFIDSLMKQLPIPSMCISLDIKTQKRLVIDGLQRITSIIKFLDNDKDWRLADVPEVDTRIAGKRVSEIKEKQEELYDRLENVTIPITVLRCDYTNENHMQYLFQIFYRLNTGANKLYNQEIRNCIYSGKFNELLIELSHSECWLQFMNVTTLKVDKSRFSHEERILRFFAYYYKYKEYNGKLAEFLNKYMGQNVNPVDGRLEEFRNLFVETMAIANKIKDKTYSKNVTDAVLVGIAKNIDRLKDATDNDINSKYNAVIGSKEFSTEELKEGLGSEERVKSRIEKAISIFGND